MHTLGNSRRPAWLIGSLVLMLTLCGWWQTSGAFAQEGGAVELPPIELEEGPLPVDGGNVAEAEDGPAIPQSPKDILAAVGIAFVLPFVAASLIAMWFSLERLVVLRKGRVIPKAFVDRFLKLLVQGNIDPQKALELCEDNASPTAMIFAHGIRKWGKSAVEVEQAIIDGGERQVSKLRKHLRVLNGVATVTPLIGLLGTVVGMIRAFNKIGGSNAMGKLSQLGSDIGLALLTTAAGLMIAIPSLIMYMYLSGKVDTLVMEMDQYAQILTDIISGEAASGPKKATASERISPGKKAS